MRWRWHFFEGGYSDKKGHIQINLNNKSRVLCSKFAVRVDAPLYASNYGLYFECDEHNYVSDNNLPRWHLRVFNRSEIPIFPRDRYPLRIPLKTYDGHKNLNQERIEPIAGDIITFTVLADRAEAKVFEYEIDKITTIHLPR